MKCKVIRSIGLVSGFLLLLTSFSTYATQFSELIVFGDSLSDTGNLFFDSNADPALIADPPAPYWNGRQSNGKIWVEYLAEKLQVQNPEASATGGTGYAYTGATAGFGNRVESSLAIPGQVQSVPRVGEQINRYLSNRGAFNESQLITIWSGANDLLEMTLEAINGVLDFTDPVSLNNRFDVTFNNLETHFRKIDSEGGKHLLIPNQGDSSKAPLWSVPPFSEAAPILAQFVSIYNLRLDELINELMADPSYSAWLYQVDMYSAFNDFINNPADFGFTEVTGFALQTNPPGLDYLFWDPIHPTTDGHAQLARVALNAVSVPAAPTLALMLLGLGIISLRYRN